MDSDQRRAAPGSLGKLRSDNRARIVTALRSEGSLSRPELARLTGLSRSTVSTVVAELIDDGLVREGTASAGRGRPAAQLILDPRAGFALAIDLAPGRIAVALAGVDHEIISRRALAAPTDTSTLPELLDVLAELVAAVLDEADAPRDRILGCVMSVPARVDPASDSLGPESALRVIAGAPVARLVRDRLDMDVRLENDANLSALAEVVSGAARGHRDVVFVELSEGIGGGVVLDGRLQRGSRGSSGEVGHISVDAEDAVCRCGNEGCLEAVASVGAVLARVAEHADAPTTIEDLITRALAGDPICARTLRDAGSRVGQTLGAVCNVVAPTMIVIGGRLAPGWPLMETAFRAALDRAAIHELANDVDVAPSALGADGRLIGGITLVLREPPNGVPAETRVLSPGQGLATLGSMTIH
ncbi:MAG: ROK family transcriptional regulator [Thermoleophilia bacterium]|nr:ROK family transcriptional regulator [Thermoleophilia bacterium]